MNQLPDPCPIPVGHFADIGGGQRIHYHDVGQGEPIIFLHGAGGGASSYSNFKGNYPAFAALLLVAAFYTHRMATFQLPSTPQ